MDRLPAGRGRRSVSTSKRALPVYCVSRPSLAIHSSGLVNHGTSRSLRRRSGTSALLSSPIDFNIDDDSDDAGDDSGDDSGIYLSDDGDDAGDAHAGSEACNDLVDDASDFGGAVAVEEAGDDAGNHGIIIPKYPWWNAPKGGKGIHMWFVKLCKGKKIDPTSLIIQPYINAKVNQSPELIWRHYVEGMEKNEAKGNGKMDATLTKLNQKKHNEKKRLRAGG